MRRLLDLILPHAWWIVGAAGLALLGALAAQTVRLAHADQALAELQAAWSKQSARSAEDARLQEARFRDEEQRRTAAHQEALDAAEEKAARARADVAVADAAAGRLRDRVAALIAAAREAAGNPQAGQAGPPTGDPAGMLADVLGRCVARVQFLATVADERGNAGQLCQQTYDALTPPEGSGAGDGGSSSPPGP